MKPEYLQKSKYNVSVYYVVVLEHFCQAGGFDLMINALKEIKQLMFANKVLSLIY